MKKKRFLTLTSSTCVLSFVALFTLIMCTPVEGGEQKPFELTISTIPAGFSSYIMGMALAEQINKNSKWLKAIATEGRGPAEHMKTLMLPARLPLIISEMGW